MVVRLVIIQRRGIISRVKRCQSERDSFSFSPSPNPIEVPVSRTKEKVSVSHATKLTFNFISYSTRKPNHGRAEISVLDIIQARTIDPAAKQNLLLVFIRTYMHGSYE